ncbi:hypothetical protein SELMODRAFT_443842 [Selaginella moellendorffii]|uniref:Uncharacterized protein n=1 Tax=Selaginella moellendorffii TaxID=88036 RepID=D8S4U8_SELML|nr:uncharacterized protein LOC9653438 [Selaginella moellendorffii]EFJ20333.1 hypothetical protein SELMODRAFT_443842 [Selaginella moellendorffii]|eukprot:XP_002978347.1 uncharacterized protein LOC9653438 [Selaginella moellendorffii]
MGDPKQEASPTSQVVTDDSGPVKVSYEIEQGEEGTYHSLKHNVEDKLHLGNQPAPGAPETREQHATPDPTKPRSSLTTLTQQDLSCPTWQQEHESTKLKVQRGEEIGTGYEPDSDSSGIA